MANQGDAVGKCYLGQVATRAQGLLGELVIMQGSGYWMKLSTASLLDVA